MKYISIFFTILLIWVAVIIVALWRQDQAQTMFSLFLMAVGATLVLFLIGFSGNK